MKRDVLLEGNSFYGAKFAGHEISPERSVNIDAPEDWVPVSIGLLGTDWALAPTALITMVLAVAAATFLLVQTVWGGLWRTWLLSGSALLYIDRKSVV